MSEYAERISADRFPLWRDRKPLLTALDMELTERCNNNCIHCCINLPADDRNAREREMGTEEIQGILAEAAGLGCLQVRFTGGEPLLRHDFQELYLFARRLGMKVLLFTNARLITPDLAGLFVSIPPLVPIEVSVYGMHAGSYEGVSRVPGSFAQFWRGVNLLLDRKVPFIVKGALLPPNRSEIEEFEAWAAGIPWMDGPPAYSMFFNLRARRDDPEKNRLIQSLRLSPEEGQAILNRNPAKYRREMAEFCSKFMGPGGDLLFSCGAGNGGCVDAYGRFQPCMGVRIPEFTYDLRRGSLREALTEFFPQLKSIRASNPEYLSRCAVCSLKGLCEQCPGCSWDESGEPDRPVEYLCRIAHHQARLLGIIKNGENAWEVIKRP